MSRRVRALLRVLCEEEMLVAGGDFELPTLGL